ncbi:GNAT family N-acetyltransferase [Tissierella carlieri]|jgi:GNAT superfamily N-acetyltransferase|uniref:GNAT family N-acetyltransferase n=1 Tax=Tissierella carlieri TaxID=689904 RepID=UPI001C108FE7|nr:GNAT family N-acetyltransferase [Tissierella carlieri]MBU5311183.1 GNAT family N-acetyltransferase [Tissierella carlieri]MDU5080786.1 GNAT family N-acetyltransferase [Bacillota bacterium]
MNIETFSEALTKVYIDNPCRIQATALWKTLEQIGNFHSNFTIEKDEVKSLKLWNKRMLHTFWNTNKNYIDEQDLGQFNMILVHQSQFNDNIKEQFPNKKSYFKLLHNNKDIIDINIPENYYIREVDINTEIQMVSDLICNCYDDIKPNVDEVLKWTKHPVFHNNLWIWIIEKKIEKPVALGIAELDMNIKEGALEWIQVLPSYHGNKLGKVLVIELLKRLEPYADFTIVSGEVDNITNPERLYRSCGFVGDDTWHIMRR